MIEIGMNNVTTTNESGKLEYVEAYSQESFGPDGCIGIKILLSVGRTLTKEERSTASRKAREIVAAVQAETARMDPQRAEAKAQMRANIIALFPQPIFVEEIPNEYCGDYCCHHIPWFVVTTRVGRIKIGWRKRVLQISWDGSGVTSTAGDLFQAEGTTKGPQMIHAWGYEKAAEYISAILGAK